MASHKAFVSVGIREPLAEIDVPTLTPTKDEVRVQVEWAAASPADLSRNDGGLFVDSYPHMLGGCYAGTVVELGPDVTRVQKGDKVFGYGWSTGVQRSFQEQIVLPEYLMGKIPDGVTLQAAAVVPANFVTIFHTATHDLGLELPWPKPEGWEPAQADSSILLWGGSSSVGQYALQILTYYGYKNLYAVASQKNASLLKELGAKEMFDYRTGDVVSEIQKRVGHVPYIIDCIGSKDGSMAPLSSIATKGTRAAIMLPVMVEDATVDKPPVYSFDAVSVVGWKDGVDVRGVRTHFHLQNEFFKNHLQPEIMPALLAKGVVKPNRQRVMEGSTAVERAQQAMEILRDKGASAERLVFQVVP